LITKFYDDVRRGRYKAEEAERIERDIDAAPREGRYRQIKLSSLQTVGVASDNHKETKCPSQSQVDITVA
jgi:hypothetical protein